MARVAEQTGMEIQYGRKIVLTIFLDTCGGHIKIAEHVVDILPSNAAADYLGRQLNLNTVHDTELANRIQRGWNFVFVSVRRRILRTGKVQTFQCSHYPYCIIWKCGVDNDSRHGEHLDNSTEKNVAMDAWWGLERTLDKRYLRFTRFYI